jgi:cell division protein FtsL
MLNTLELAVVAIALAWLIIIVTIGLVYLKINHQQREIRRIEEKVTVHEESIKDISRFFSTIQGEKSTA